MELAKRGVERLPSSWRRSLKQRYFARLARTGALVSDEPEFSRLSEWVNKGDWVVDVGANVGQFTLRFSDIVGPSGRVLAFEPIAETFALLTANCQSRNCRNVSLFNMALSNRLAEVQMDVPLDGHAIPNLYQAHIVDGPAQPSMSSVLCFALDAMKIDRRISMVKIDAEGHEREVIEGMLELLKRSRPMVIIEGSRAHELLASIGYEFGHLTDSPNYICRFQAPEPASPSLNS